MPVRRSATLPDGRLLSCYEVGDPDGTPCFYIPGTPVSGLAGEVYAEPAATSGVRVLSVDKPGYGHSSLNRRGTLATFGADLLCLADELGFTSFTVIGESGGGPYALAVARYCAPRVRLAVVLVGMGPGHESWAREGMKPVNKLIVLAAQRAPWSLLPLLGLYAWMNKTEKRALRLDSVASLPPADRAMFEKFGAIDFAALQDSFRQGLDGMIQEATLLARPWGFRIEDVGTRVELWHGTADVNVPIRLARLVAGKLPDAQLHVLEGVGHAAGHVARDEVMAAVAKACA